MSGPGPETNGRALAATRPGLLRAVIKALLGLGLSLGLTFVVPARADDLLPGDEADVPSEALIDTSSEPTDAEPDTGPSDVTPGDAEPDTGPSDMPPEDAEPDDAEPRATPEDAEPDDAEARAAPEDAELAIAPDVEPKDT